MLKALARQDRVWPGARVHLSFSQESRSGETEVALRWRVLAKLCDTTYWEMLYRHGGNNNLQLQDQTNSRPKIAFIIAPVKRSLAESHLHGVAASAVAGILMANGIN